MNNHSTLGPHAVQRLLLAIEELNTEFAGRADTALTETLHKHLTPNRSCCYIKGRHNVLPLGMGRAA